MRDLVPIALLIVDVAGGFTEARSFLITLQQKGVQAYNVELPGWTDKAVVAKKKATELGLVDQEGQPVFSRIAETLLVLDVLEAFPQESQRPDPPEPLVLTVTRRA